MVQGAGFLEGPGMLIIGHLLGIVKEEVIAAQGKRCQVLFDQLEESWKRKNFRCRLLGWPESEQAIFGRLHTEHPWWVLGATIDHWDA